VSRLTRPCLHPWRTVCFSAEGKILPCCAAIDGEYGNLNRDCFDREAGEGPSDLFRNEAYLELRKGLLEGNPIQACQVCRIVPEGWIPVEGLEAMVSAYLARKGLDPVGADLTRLFVFERALGSLTNRCNFSCIYCVQSVTGEDRVRLALGEEMADERFFSFIELLVQGGLRELVLVGIGELTHFEGWEAVCGRLFDAFPKLRVSLTSNFGRLLHASELEVLSRFDTLCISCDTLDADLYARLRRGGKLSTLLQNLRRLQALPQPLPKVCLNVVISDLVIPGLEEVARFAVENGFFLNFSNLYIALNSAAERTGALHRVEDMPRAEMPAIWDLLQHLPRRIKAGNPHSDIWDLGSFYEHVRQNALALTCNEFVPGAEEEVYRLFAAQHPQRQDAFLKRIYTGFDDQHRGILLRAGSQLQLQGLFASLLVRPVWCHLREDGNLTFSSGQPFTVDIGGDLRVTFGLPPGSVNAVLLEVLESRTLEGQGASELTLDLEVPAGVCLTNFAWERVLLHEVDRGLQAMVRSREPVAVWCAGARTLSLLEGTCLGQLDIRMVIDRARAGSEVGGLPVSAPEAIRDFRGVILVAHATAPYRIEQDIRNMGIHNMIHIL